MEQLTFEGFGGVRLVADAFGSDHDPSVLLVPSVTQTREFWHEAAQALAEAGRYAICLDLRGHGDSDHASDGRYDFDVHIHDLRAVLASLPTRAVIAAAGYGGILSLAAVGESATPLVSGLVLIDTSIWFDPSVARRLRDGLRHRIGQPLDPAAMAESLAADFPAEPRPTVTQRLLAAFREQPGGTLAWRGDPRVLEVGELLDKEDRLQAAAAQVRVPVTLVRGSLNETVTAELARRLQDLIPGCELVEIEGAGHYVGTDREDAFNAILVDFLERKAPRKPLSYIGGSEPRVLRDALGCFGTGVTVVTTFDSQGEPVGLTANSFTSVSLDPPLILFSLARSSASLPTFVDAGRFAVNVLHIGQQPVANRFAQRDVARFSGVDWSVKHEGGSPILDGSLASFDCRTFAVHEGGDHLVFVGQVEHAWFEPHRDPLLYFRGKYRRLHFA